MFRKYASGSIHLVINEYSLSYTSRHYTLAVYFLYFSKKLNFILFYSFSKNWIFKMNTFACKASKCSRLMTLAVYFFYFFKNLILSFLYFLKNLNFYIFLYFFKNLNFYTILLFYNFSRWIHLLVKQANVLDTMTLTVYFCKKLNLYTFLFFFKKLFFQKLEFSRCLHYIA